VSDLQPSEASDPLVAATNELATALRYSVTVSMQALERLDEFRAERVAGIAYAELVDLDVERSVAEMLSDIQDRLARSAAPFRREAARMMQDQGVSQSDIARRFGVSRQRVAALLSDESGLSGDLGSDLDSG
jgi:helix-turn-helix protein